MRVLIALSSFPSIFSMNLDKHKHIPPRPPYHKTHQKHLFQGLLALSFWLYLQCRRTLQQVLRYLCSQVLLLSTLHGLAVGSHSLYNLVFLICCRFKNQETDTELVSQDYLSGSPKHVLVFKTHTWLGHAPRDSELREVHTCSCSTCYQDTEWEVRTTARKSKLSLCEA